VGQPPDQQPSQLRPCKKGCPNQPSPQGPASSGCAQAELRCQCCRKKLIQPGKAAPSALELGPGERTFWRIRRSAARTTGLLGL